MCSSDLFPSHDICCKYYRDRLYTEEERRKLWTIQPDKNEGKITIDGVEYLDNEESKRTINQAIKNNELKNIELGYPNEKQIKAIKQINAKKREIIATHKVVIELKKANESYKHIIQECEKEKEMLKMLKEHNKKLLEKQTYVHSRRQYDINQFKT